MHGYGGGRVNKALFSYPCGVSGVAILVTIKEVLKQQIEEDAYKAYTAECFRIITENTANVSNKSYINKSYVDMIYPQAVDNRTGEEIAADVIKKAGLKVI